MNLDHFAHATNGQVRAQRASGAVAGQCIEPKAVYVGVTQALDRLNQAVGSLDGAMGELGTRLIPYTHPGYAHPAGQSDVVPECCQTAASIYKAAEVLFEMARRVRAQTEAIIE